MPQAEAAWLPLRRVAGRPLIPLVENDDISCRLGWLSPWATVGQLPVLSTLYSSWCWPRMRTLSRV